MQYTSKFQAMADAARAQTDEVPASEVDSLIAAGASRWISATRKNMMRITSQGRCMSAVASWR